MTFLTLGISLPTLLAVAKAQVAESDFFAYNFVYKKKGIKLISQVNILVDLENISQLCYKKIHLPLEPPSAQFDPIRTNS
jgi:hypothetical protein